VFQPCLLEYLTEFDYKERVWRDVDFYQAGKDFLNAWSWFGEIHSRDTQQFFCFQGDSWYGNPFTSSKPSAVFICGLQYLLSEPNTLVDTPELPLKNTSAVAVWFFVKFAWISNLLLSARGNCCWSAFHAFSYAEVAIFFASGVLIHFHSASSIFYFEYIFFIYIKWLSLQLSHRRTVRLFTLTSLFRKYIT